MAPERKQSSARWVEVGAPSGDTRRRDDLEAQFASGFRHAAGARRFSLAMSARRLTDEELIDGWFPWFAARLAAAQETCEQPLDASEVDFSENRLTSSGARQLLETFSASRINVQVLKIYRNKIDGDFGLPEFIAKSQGRLREVHISHNELGTKAAGDVALAVLNVMLPSGLPAFPQAPKDNPEGPLVPFWLRLEQNGIDADVMLKRIHEGFNPSGRLGPALCAAENKGCTPRRCANCGSAPQSQPSALHLKYLSRQRTETATASASASANASAPLPEQAGPRAIEPAVEPALPAAEVSNGICFSAGIPGTDVYGKQVMLLMKHCMIAAPDAARHRKVPLPARNADGKALPNSSASTCSGTDESHEETPEDAGAGRLSRPWFAMASADVDSRTSKARAEKRSLNASAAEFVPLRPIVRAELSLHVQTTADYAPRAPCAPPGVHLFSGPQVYSPPSPSAGSLLVKLPKTTKAKPKAATQLPAKTGPATASTVSSPALPATHTSQNSKVLLSAATRAPFREQPPTKPRPPTDPPNLTGASHEGPPVACVVATAAACVAAGLALAINQRRRG